MPTSDEIRVLLMRVTAELHLSLHEGPGFLDCTRRVCMEVAAAVSKTEEPAPIERRRTLTPEIARASAGATIKSYRGRSVRKEERDV